MQAMMRNYKSARQSFLDGNLPQTLVVDANLKIEVKGDNWEKSVAEQLGFVQDGEFPTLEDDYWHHIWWWVAKHRCFMHQNWHVKVRNTQSTMKSKVIESLIADSKLAQLGRNTLSRMENGGEVVDESEVKKKRKKKKKKKPKDKSSRALLCDTVENFITAVNKGMTSFEDEGLMSKDDIASLKHTTNLMNRKVKRLKWCGEKKDSENDCVNLIHVEGLETL